MARFAGYAQEPDLRGTVRPKGLAKRMRERRVRLSDLPQRARHLIEVYLEARESGSVRHAEAVREAMADIGFALDRSGDPLELVAALAGEDYEATCAVWATALILVDHGQSPADAFRAAFEARKPRTIPGWTWTAPPEAIVRCARPGCRNEVPHNIGGGRRAIYCSVKCSQAVRDSRRRGRKAEGLTP